MTIAELIPLLLELSIALTVFAVGLGTERESIGYLRKRPGLLLRSLLSTQVVAPLVAVALAIAFDFFPGVKVALVALAVSPISPALPKMQLKAGGRGPYAVGLLSTTALLSVVTIPITLALIGPAFGASVHVPASLVARTVLTTVLLPLVGGVATRLIAQELADRLAHPISLVAGVILILAAIPIVVAAWPAVAALIGNGTLLVIVVFTVVGLVAGHMLGGADLEDRIVLALSTASRHPGVAISVAAVAAPAQKRVAAAILLYLVVNVVTVLLYTRWVGRHRSVPTEIPGQDDTMHVRKPSAPPGGGSQR